MINHTLHIDTLKFQSEFMSSYDQHNVIDRITKALITTYSYLSVEYAKGNNTSGILIHSIHTAGKKILELKSGSYLINNYRGDNRITIYYISIEFAGLMRYDNKIDDISLDCLLRVVAYLNTRSIRFFYTGIDIAVDMRCSFAFTHAFCNKKAAGVKYYKVYDRQPYLTSQYIEKYDNTHNRVMKRSYLYDKSIKEDGLTYPITRFELKLQSSFFNRYPYLYGMLSQELDRYHILYFPTLNEKDEALSLYAQYEDSIRRRDLHKLGFNRYRIYPDTRKIEEFLFSLYDVYESDLNLPVEEVDNGFDWLFEEV